MMTTRHVATPAGRKNIFGQAYGNPSDVNDKVVDVILTAGLAPGAAADVFLDFMSYSSGPLPEDLLPILDPARCPVRILWDTKDPWEPIEKGRALYAPFADEFVMLQRAGHCPMDQVTPSLILTSY